MTAERPAVHESAHLAVSYLVDHGPIVEVLVRDDGSGLMDDRSRAVCDVAPEDRAAALARLRSDQPDLLRAICGRAIATALAGPIADQRQGYVDLLPCRNDFAVADRLADLAVGRENRDRWMAPLRTITRLAVGDAWPMIETLADWLQRARRLEGVEVTAWLDAQPQARSLRAYYRQAFEPADSTQPASPAWLAA
jgi:hypothetical protein